METLFEKVGQPTVDANEDLLTKLVTVYEKVLATTKLHIVEHFFQIDLTTTLTYPRATTDVCENIKADLARIP